MMAEVDFRIAAYAHVERYILSHRIPNSISIFVIDLHLCHCLSLSFAQSLSSSVIFVTSPRFVLFRFGSVRVQCMPQTVRSRRFPAEPSEAASGSDAVPPLWEDLRHRQPPSSSSGERSRTQSEAGWRAGADFTKRKSAAVLYS